MRFIPAVSGVQIPPPLPLTKYVKNMEVCSLPDILEKCRPVRVKESICQNKLNMLKIWKFSSAGRASALQAEGHRFEPCNFHFFMRSGGSLRFRQNLSRKRLQAFDELEQRNKQISSSGASTLKLPVFLGEKRGFRLRIPFGKRFVSQTLPRLCCDESHGFSFCNKKTAKPKPCRLFF